MGEAGEIIKSGAMDKLADIFQKLAGPLAEEFGLLLADKAKVYRVKNWVSVVKKTQAILSEANLPPNAVPPRLFLPILEASSLEEDETLQGLWAGLLASASDESDLLSPSLVETLKQLTPGQARYLGSLFDFAQTQFGLRFSPPDSLGSLIPQSPPNEAVRLMTETFERLGLICRRYELEPRDKGIFGFGMVDPYVNPSWGFFGDREKEKLPKLKYELEFTGYGTQFMRACRGPGGSEARPGPT